MSEIAYVAALKREVAPLIRGWRRTRNAYSGRNFEFFENGDTVLVCGGIGPEAARRATEAVIALYHPNEVVSVGFVGALDPGMHVGDIAEPATVVDARDGGRIATGSGAGVLVSFGSVAESGQKQKLSRAYNAQTVDMEAASVARGAQTHGLNFRAVKAVSDELEFPMPPMGRFIAADGTFRTSSFALFAALRPAMWPTAIRLARNSERASRALCARLRDETASAIHGLQPAPSAERKQ
jgi:adenosylhomocysteine nucleosidase